jgi:hypothetical protein
LRGLPTAASILKPFLDNVKSDGERLRATTGKVIWRIVWLHMLGGLAF